MFSEPTTTASRFKVIKSQTPNPRTFKTGRWKVLSITYLLIFNFYYGLQVD